MTASARVIREVSQVFSFDPKKFEAELLSLERILNHDEYTYVHSMNVAILAVAIGRRLGLSEQTIVELGWAALLHDVGKLFVPLEILNKANKLTPDERVIMRGHPVESLTKFAEQHMITLSNLQRLSAAFEHHQRYDLKGYPQVHQKFSLHPFSRIVAVADTFDAMTSDRHYQRRLLPDLALKIMSTGFGTIFDPTVLQALITCMGAYPVGSLIRLSNEGLAIVVQYRENSHVDRPVILPLNKEKQPLPLIDLMTEGTHLKISRSEFPEDHDIPIAPLLKAAQEQLRQKDQAS